MRDLLAALVVGCAVSILAAWLTTETWPLFLPELADQDGRPAFPTVRIAVVTIIVLTLATYLTAPVRRFGRWVIIATTLAPIVLVIASLTSAAGALTLAVFSVALVRLLFGSPEGLPPIGRLAETLRRVDVPVHDLTYDDDQPPTVGLATATSDDGQTLTIKVHGQDTADRQRTARIWRSLWYRSGGPTPSAGRVEQVEHEALALVLAARAGVTVPIPVRGGQVEHGDAVLVTVEPEGRTLAEIGEADGTIDDEQLRAVWRSIERLHASRIAHGTLDADTVRVGRDGPVLVDLQNASLLPTAQQYAADVASLLGVSATIVGTERAVDAASVLGRSSLTGSLPYLQDAVVAPRIRARMKAADVDFDAIRDAVASRLGVEQPELAEVRRVSVQDVVMVVFGVIAANALISQIAEVGFDALRDELASASLGWLIVAFLLKLASYPASYLGLSAAVTQPVPFGPTVLLQSANSFVGLVVPSTVGRVAMSVRFLQKLGVPTATAVAQGPIVSFVGFLVEVVLLLVTAWALGEELESEGLGAPGSGGLLVIAVAVVVVGLVVVALTPRLRRAVVPRIVQAYRSVREVVTTPARLGQICLGEFLERMSGALALAATVAAFGASLSFTALIFVSVGTGLLAGLAPVPGGIGVAEATMTALLTGVGLPAEQAFSIAITYRVVTAYLPPVLGWFSFRWLTEKGFI